MKPALLFYCLVTTCFFTKVNGQSIEEQMTRRRPTCNDVFLNAVNVLPKLYRQNAFDSMHTALQIWKESCGNTVEIECTDLLLAMQQGNFNADTLDSTTIDLLEQYAHSFIYFKADHRLYSETQTAFYKFSSIWAKLLMEQKRLDETEKFICLVFKGDIAEPKKQMKNHPEKYPQLALLVKQQQAALRKGFRANRSILLGIWMPKGDLQILGNHPSFGFQFGGRDVHNQFDFTLQFRFAKSAHPYFFKRNSAFYESVHYFGGYIGFDYTYYFLSKQKYDFGILTGVGFDGFDITDGQHTQGLSPTSINSFNANGGLKYNWYVTPTFYFGLQGRYNLINYCNGGGTSLQGNAFSVDFIIGGNSFRR